MNITRWYCNMFRRLFMYAFYLTFMLTTSSLICSEIQDFDVIDIESLHSSLGSNRKIDILDDFNLKSYDETSAGLSIIDSDNLTISGTDSLAGFFMWDDANPILSFSNCNNIRLSNLKLGHKGSNDKGSATPVVQFVNCSNVILDNCIIYGCGPYGYTYGLNIDNTSQFNFMNSVIKDCNLGISVVDSSVGVSFENCVFSQNRGSAGISLSQTSDIVIDSCRVSNNEVTSVYNFDKVTNTKVTNCLFSENTCKNGVIVSNNSAEILIENCILNKNTGDFGLSLGQTSDIFIDSCRVSNNDITNIFNFDKVSNAKAINCLFSENACINVLNINNNSKGVLLEKCTLTKNTGSLGLVLDQTTEIIMDNCTLSSNGFSEVCNLGKVSNIKIINSMFSDNDCKSSMIVTRNNSQDILLKKCVFNQNKATSNFMLEKTAEVTIDSCSISNNRLNNMFNIGLGSNLIIMNSVYSNNAISKFSSTFSCIDCIDTKFIDNSLDSLSIINEIGYVGSSLYNLRKSVQSVIKGVTRLRRTIAEKYVAFDDSLNTYVAQHKLDMSAKNQFENSNEYYLRIAKGYKFYANYYDKYIKPVSDELSILRGKSVYITTDVELLAYNADTNSYRISANDLVNNSAMNFDVTVSPVGAKAIFADPGSYKFNIEYRLNLKDELVPIRLFVFNKGTKICMGSSNNDSLLLSEVNSIAPSSNSRWMRAYSYPYGVGYTKSVVFDYTGLGIITENRTTVDPLNRFFLSKDITDQQSSSTVINLANQYGKSWFSMDGRLIFSSLWDGRTVQILARDSSTLDIVSDSGVLGRGAVMNVSADSKYLLKYENSTHKVLYKKVGESTWKECYSHTSDFRQSLEGIDLIMGRYLVLFIPGAYRIWVYDIKQSRFENDISVDRDARSCVVSPSFRSLIVSTENYSKEYLIFKEDGQF